jgi:hypothetical protein
MVDRCERWEVQDGERKISDPNVIFVARGQGLGRGFKQETRRHLSVSGRPTRGDQGSRENWAKFSLKISPPWRF